MASAILTWVAKQAGSFIFDLVKNELFGEAADNMSILIKQQEEIKHTIETLELEGRIYESSQHIMDWTVQLREKLAVADRGNQGELDRFVVDISNANTGIHYALSNLYNGLIGETGTGTGPKLLDTWHENAYRHLANTGELDYTIPNYVKEMDDKLEAVFELIRNGLILLNMTTEDKQQANDWTTEWHDKMQGLMQIVYDNYPPALKLFKPTYESDWQPQTWWRLRLRNYQRYLFRRSNGSVDFYGDPERTAEWKFDPAVESGLVGLYGRDDHRLKLTTYSAAGMVGHLEMMTQGDEVVYKLIPLIDVNEPIIQLAGPYNASDKSKEDCSLNKDMGVCVPFHDWVLQKV